MTTGTNPPTPGPHSQSNLDSSSRSLPSKEVMQQSKEPFMSSFLTPEIVSFFIDGQYKGVWRSLVRMWKEEGFKGFMRGNGINCLRIVPYSAVQFTTYEQLKKPPTSSIPKHATAAAFHTTSPGKSFSTATASGYTKADLTIKGMTLKIMREEGGVRGLYRGLVTTSAGVAPYVGINFAAYEFLRGIITPPGKSSIWRKLTCGALAGTISQTLTYPFDVLRRKMQVTGMKGGSVKYDGALDALKSIIKAEGVAGLYRGLWPNLRKQRIYSSLTKRADGTLCSQSCAQYRNIILHI
ncbi:hypothetical protein C0992_005971 [Termitomyces sp. T32_za158]|nr:hypothetical protein C0992_005971 [Termitomyces sp. T32_za158]